MNCHPKKFVSTGSYLYSRNRQGRGFKTRTEDQSIAPSSMHAVLRVYTVLGREDID